MQSVWHTASLWFHWVESGKLVIASFWGLCWTFTWLVWLIISGSHEDLELRSQPGSCWLVHTFLDWELSFYTAQAQYFVEQLIVSRAETIGQKHKQIIHRKVKAQKLL